MLRKRFLLVCLLFLAAINASSAQAVARPDTARVALSRRWGTWSAANSNGRTFTGTWTGVPDTSGAVTGTWTLSDAQGKAVMNGGWSAAKAPAQWSGAWRGRIAGRTEDFSGTWTASTDLKGDARISDLFEKAVQAAVSGAWRAGNQSGAWAIRTGKGEGSP